MRYSITYSLKRLRQSIPVIRDRVLIFNLLFVAILTLPSYMMGQVYEIYSKTTVLPPYPITLDGFAAEGGTKLQVQITSSDITRAQYPVLLKLVIKGNGITIESKSLFISDPVYVNGNETTLLNGSDLAVFFNPDNLNFSGYSKTQYQRNGRLPEGVYSVSFELYDEFRARQNIFINVARALPGMVFMFLNEVPSLTLPMNNEVISAAGNPSINFRWTTRHSPLAATFFTPQYLFELWDVVPQGTNPYQAVRGTRPLFATTCEATYLTYGIAETPLQPGHTYAWRVREVDPEGKTMLKNDGYTDVYTFTYGRNCPAPELSADKTGTSHFSVTWQADPSQKQFELRIRDKKKKDAEWYTLKSGLLSAKVDQLKPNTIYEAEVCAICGDQRSEYSNRLEITTRQNTSFNCGQADSSKLPQNQNPLRKLSKGDVFTASTFTVEVSEASGSNGTFTGKGFILVPYLNFIKVEAKFQNIRINEEYQLIGGEVQTVYNISNSLTAKIDGIVKTIQGDGELNPYDSKAIAGKIIKVDSVKTIRVVNGQVIVTDVNGKEETATLAKDKLVVVKTQEGSQYVVDGATNTIYTSANSGQKSAGGTPAGNITTASEAGKGNTPQFNLSFLPHTLQKYSYDIPSDKSPAENYESTNITGQPTLVPWKSLEAGRTEYVMAGITGGPADSIRYYRESNNMVMTAPGTSSNVLNGKTAPGQEFKQLLLTGTLENTTDKLFAWYPSYNDDTTKTYSRILAGQLNMASYEKKTIQVVLVPVNKSICPDPLYVEKELNRIYQSAVIDWNVTQMAAIDATFAGPVFDNTSPKEHLDYTPDMERVINQFKSSDAYSRDKFYLFFLDNAKDPNIKGFMPFKKQFGFIFKYQQYPDEYMRTIAHELGHGALRLWHTFSSNNQYIQPEGSTNNLMDYVDRSKADSAILLNKYQWDWAHDPTWRVYAFEDQEEAALFYHKQKIKILFEKLRYAYAHNSSTKIIYSDFSETLFSNNINLSSSEILMIGGEKFRDIEVGLPSSSKFTIYPKDEYKTIHKINRDEDLVEIIYEDVVAYSMGSIRTDLVIRVKKEDAQALVNYLFPKINVEVWKEKAKLLLNAPAIEDMLSYPEEAYGVLDITDRMKYLNRLADENINDTWLGSVSKEKVILRLIETTPENQIINFFEQLQKNDLMLKLDRKLNNVGGDDNFSNFYFTLLNLYNKSYAKYLKKKELTSQALIIWNTNMIGGYLVPYMTYYYKGKIKVFSRQTQKTIEYDPFNTIIMLHCESKLLNNQINEDLIIPAFFFHWIANEHVDRTKFSTVDFGIDVASLFVGYGEVRVAIKAKKYLMAGLSLAGVIKTSVDLSSNICKTFINQEVKNKISKYKGGDFFLNKWEDISPYIELNLFASTVVTTGMIESFETFNASWNVLELNSDLRKELGESKFQQINDFSEYLAKLVGEMKQ